MPKKSKKYFCKGKPEYTKDYVHFTASKRGASHAYCVLCKQDFSISHGGRNDLDKHKNTLSHCQAEKSTSDASSFKDFFTCRTTSNLEEDTIQAEAKMCQMIAAHNLSLATADAFAKLFQDMFPKTRKVP